MELIADSMDLDRPDLFKRLKLMQDADAIVAYSREQIAAHGLEVEEVRDAVVKYLLAIKFCPSTRLFIRNHDRLRYHRRTALFAPRRSLRHSHLQCPDLWRNNGRYDAGSPDEGTRRHAR